MFDAGWRGGRDVQPVVFQQQIDTVAKCSSLRGAAKHQCLSLSVLRHPSKCFSLPGLPMVATAEERMAFKEFIQRTENSEKLYFEWGTGGSTTIAAPWFKLAFSVENHPEWFKLAFSVENHKLAFSVENHKLAFSVENHPEWCEKMRKLELIVCLSNEGRHRFVCEAPTDKLQEFGVPEIDEAHKFGNYIDMMDQVVTLEREIRGIIIDHFDVVFIDGRFRVACGLAALKYINYDSVVVIHDFHRPEYQILRAVYDVERQVSGLAFLRKKHDIVNADIDRLKAAFATERG